MKIVVALDSFKGSLSAEEACLAVTRGLQRIRPSADCLQKPMADGGEGTARTLLSACGGAWVPVSTTGPLESMRVEAGFALLKNGLAVVEMAEASGLTLLHADRLAPMDTTTFGTGQLLAAAAKHRPERILLAVGGSATVDAGVGAAAALGWRFLDAAGRPLTPGGGALIRTARVLPPSQPWTIPVEVLCDVDNPLLGPRGAARVFGPQKGAGPEEVMQLEAGLAQLREIVLADLGMEMDFAGGGAAGGLSAGAAAFLGASVRSGVEVVMEAVAMEDALLSADWVITGEGRFDEQSLGGKVVSGILAAAQKAGCRVAVLAGQIQMKESGWRAAGIQCAEAASGKQDSPAYAMEHAAALLEAAAARLCSQLG